MNVTGTNKARSVSTTAVAAAASVPSSLTSTKALWMTFDTTRSFAGDMPVSRGEMIYDASFISNTGNVVFYRTHVFLI